MLYDSWKEYYNSEQDDYLDEHNCADDDVRLEFGSVTVRGKTSYNAYEIYCEEKTLGVFVGALDDALKLFGLRFCITDNDGTIYAHDIESATEADLVLGAIMAEYEQKNEELPIGLEIMEQE